MDETYHMETTVKHRLLAKGCISGEQMPTLNDVFLVEGLKHNLLSISPLCDKGNKVVCDS